MNGLEFLFGFGLLFGLFAFVFAIAAYVLIALALMTMAQNKGIEYPWLAWLPVGNMYIVGKIIGKLNVFGIEIENPEMVLPIASLAGFFLAAIPLIGFLLSLAVMVLSLVAFYNLIEMYKKGSGALYLILLIFIAPLGAFMFFGIKDNTPA